MSMILYHGEPNGPSLAVLAALHESGVAVECRNINLLAGERHTIPHIAESVARDMGVEGEGPVLVVGGEAMTESVFIAQFLDESGANTLQPKEAYAHWQMLMWCRRITERCAPAAAFLGCKAHAGAINVDLTTIKSDDLRARWAAVQAGDFPQAQVDDSLTKIRDAVALVEEQLSDGRWGRSPSPILKPMAGWLAWSILCPTRLTVRRKPSPGWAAFARALRCSPLWQRHRGMIRRTIGLPGLKSIVGDKRCVQLIISTVAMI
jgi:GSH-dependent disulfide-bond oxidoreductase